MSAITNVWRQLVQRRLWPVAILLIAALAAVPMMLADDPGPPAPAAPAVVTADSDKGETALATEPIVAQATAADRTKRRNVLGARKDPFGVPQEQDAGSATAPSSDGSKTAVDPVSPSSTPTTVSGGTPTSPTTPTVTGPVSPTTPTTPTTAPKTYAMHELTVRFGESADGTGSRRSLERLQPLPSKANPVLIYLGVLKDGKTAVFLVDQGVSAVGDGDCRPTPVECETVRLRAGETEFFDVLDEAGGVGAQYQLDLVKIHKGRTTSATRAQASSKPGRRLLHARVAADGPTGYRWDASAGALERSGAGLRASVASSTVSLP